MLNVEVVEDLATEPVTVAEAKSFLVIDADYTADDTLIGGLITAARGLLEHYTNKSFGEKTLKAFTDKGTLMLPFGPVIEVTEVVDQDDTTIPEADYTVKGLPYPNMILTGGGDLSHFYQRNMDQCGVMTNTGYYITYTAGYGSTGREALPEALKLAIKEQVREMYNTRGVSPSEPGLTAKILADPYCRRSWI